MSPTISILVTVAGGLLILAALRDVFDALFHPGGRATMSRAVMRAVWRVFHPIARRRPSSISLAGPTALILIVGCWATALVVGWAFVFWPHMDGGFKFQPGAEHGGGEGLIDALYLSITTLTTVGFGDVTPDEGLLRIITPLEALIGFGLLTASISWLAAIYPVLQRRRSLAYEVHLMREAQDEADVEVGELEPAAAAGVYSELTSRVIAVERDLEAFPIAYYFAETDDRFSLAVAAPYLYRVALRGTGDGNDEHPRLRAMMLRDAVADLAATAAHRFHGRPGESTEEALEEFARDHLREPAI